MCRNLRQLDPKIVASRKLDFFAYSLYLPNNWEPKDSNSKKPISQSEALKFLKNIGFKVNDTYELKKDLNEANKYYHDHIINVCFIPNYNLSCHDLPN